MEIVEYIENMELDTEKVYKTNDGYYRLIDNGCYKAISKVGDLKIEGKLQEKLLELKTKKIDYQTFMQIQQFFIDVYDKHSAEAVVVLWYNPRTKVWRVEVPEQKVAGASADYIRDEELAKTFGTEGFYCFGSIHSHGSMSAFHSGTDDKDEYGWDGVHITIGKVNSKPQYSARVIIKNKCYMAEIQGVVDMPEETLFETPQEWLEKVNKSAPPQITTNWVDKTRTKDTTYDFEQEDLGDYTDDSPYQGHKGSKRNKRGKYYGY